MKKLLTALSLGLALTVMLLWGLVAGPTLVAQARDNLPEAQMRPEHNLPLLQAGTGVIRVAPSGADVSGCGSAVSPCASVQFAVNEAIPGDTVILSAGTWNESVTLSQPISLTGVSSATAIIQALPGQRVLTVTGAAIDSSVVISGLTFSGGDVSGGNICFSGDTTNCGGGILLTNDAQPAIQNVIIENNDAFRGGGLYANETGGLVLDRVIFRNNSAILTGGGLNAPNMPVTITNSLFRQNTTTNNVGGAMVTGASFGIVAPVLISNTTFLSNTAQCLGGLNSICEAPAVRLFDQDAQIINSHFEGNSCTAPNCDGGGVFMSASFNDPSFSLVNTDFISNTAGAQGGGVYATIPVQVTGGRFERNAATGQQTAFSDGGGGMRVESLILTGTEFISNTSGEDGGAINVRGDAVIRDARLTANQAITNGGGIYVLFDLVMTGTEFISNTAGMNGGGAYVFLGDAQVTGGRFDRNRANGPENDGAFLTFENGGGGLWVGNNVTLSGTEFSDNVAETNGGGAHIRGSAVLNGGRFEQNRSLGNFVSSQSYGGGGLYVANTLSLTDTIFTGNQAAFLGGGLWTSQDVSGLNGLFQNNNAGRGAGGLFTLNNLTLANSQFIDNEADFVGGGALVDGIATLTDTLFQANRVISTALGTSSGGLAASEGFTATNTQFIGNSSTGNAGGASSFFGPVNLNNSLFRDNVSDGSGGGLSASFDPITISDTEFINNTAEVRGGGIVASGPINSNSGLFQNNRTNTASGGGLYTSSRLIMTDTQFISNSAAVDGGGVLANSGVVASDGLFERNQSVTGNGGGVNAPLGTFDFENVAFVENSAGGDGGGAYTGFRSVIESGRFQDNTAANGGGGMWAENRTLMTATTFINNQAGGPGGGLVITGTFETPNRLINNLFARNSSPSGNGLFISLPDNPNFPDGDFGTVEMIHNTIATPNGINGSALELISGTVRITNTIIASHSTGIDNAGGIVTEDFNLFFGNGSNTQGTVGGGANSFVGNPAFVDPANDDYHLTPDSLAINKAIAAGILIDFDGEPRPGGGGFDIGFDETAFPPELQVNKTATPNTDVSYQGELTYTITLSNGSIFDASGVLFNDTLPGQVDFARWVEQPPGAGATADEITWNGTVSGTGAVTFTFVVSHVGDYGDVFTNTADFVHPLSGLDGSATAQASIAGPPELSISKAAEPDTEVTYQGEVTYTIVISNDGPSDANDTLLIDTLPISTTFARWLEQPAGASVLTDVVRWNGTVPANDAVTFDFVISHTGYYSDVVTNIADYGHLTGAGSAQATFTVEPLVSDLFITKSSIRNEENGVISYTVVVQNLGPDDAGGAVVSDSVPAGLNSFAWQCAATGGAVCVPSGSGDINDTLTSLPVGSQVVYSVTATLVSTDLTIINIAEIIPPTGLINTAFSASAINTSGPIGNIYLPVLFKGAGPPPVLPPDLIVSNLVANSNSVSVTVKNIGTGPVVDAFWVDVYIDPDAPPTAVNQPWYDLGDQGLVWGVEGTPPFLAPGQSLTLTIGGPYYFGFPLSEFTPPLQPGTPIYAQVDSFNLSTTFGNVAESDENNNITGTVSIQGVSAAEAATATGSQPSPDGGLPPR